MTKSIVILTSLVLLLQPAMGCARVKPWQRGTLADPIMQADRDPMGGAFADHVFFSREAATGGRAISGAGCGCN